MFSFYPRNNFDLERELNRALLFPRSNSLQRTRPR
jgi:hypothetical protein